MAMIYELSVLFVALFTQLSTFDEDLVTHYNSDDIAMPLMEFVFTAKISVYGKHVLALFAV